MSKIDLDELERQATTNFRAAVYCISQLDLAELIRRLREAEADIAMLRAALVGLIGADSEQELRQMEVAMRMLPAPDADKAVSINAIHALLATMTPN